MIILDIGIKYLDYFIGEKSESIHNLIEGIDTYRLPNNFKSVEEYEKFCTQELNLTHVSTTMKKDIEMIEILVESMFAQNIILSDEIDVIIFAQDCLNYQTENIAQYIQYKFKIKNSFTLNVCGNYCSNVETALTVGYSLLYSNISFNNILIISVQKIIEHYQRIIKRVAFLGDGAGIMLLSKKDFYVKVIGTKQITDGRFYDTSHISISNNDTLIHYKNSIHNIKSTLNYYSIDNNKISSVIIPNTNKNLYKLYLDQLNIDNKLLFSDNIGKYGHITCIDFIINLKDNLESKKLNLSDIILSFSVGWAGSYQTTLLEVCSFG